MERPDDFVPDDKAIERALRSTRSIAVVGLSDDPIRPSYDVAEYLARVGYEIVPINPFIGSWNGRRSFASLTLAAQAGKDVRFVDVFRRSADVGPVTEEAIAIGAKCIWYQLGVINEEAARRAKKAGLLVVMDRCTKIEHRRLVR